MARVTLTLLLAVAVASVSPRASACICIVESVKATEPAGRVFALDGTLGPEPVAGAQVVLLKSGDRSILASCVTDDQGAFRLANPGPGKYRIEVSLLGFHDTSLVVEIKRRRWGKPKVLAVRLDLAGFECRCGAACNSSQQADGLASATCLLKTHE
jgi:hypothetical protein